MKDDKKIIYVRERTVQSFFADAITFAVIVASFWFNYKFIDGNNWLDALLFICFFIFAIGRASDMKRQLDEDSKS